MRTSDKSLIGISNPVIAVKVLEFNITGSRTVLIVIYSIVTGSLSCQLICSIYFFLGLPVTIGYISIEAGNWLTFLGKIDIPDIPEITSGNTSLLRNAILAPRL